METIENGQHVQIFFKMNILLHRTIFQIFWRNKARKRLMILLLMYTFATHSPSPILLHLYKQTIGFEVEKIKKTISLIITLKIEVKIQLQ